MLRRLLAEPTVSPVAAPRGTRLESLEVRRLLSAATLDFSRTDNIDGFDFGGAVAVQPWDDMIVALVNTDGGAKLARYTAAGAPAGAPVDLGATAQIATAVNVAVSGDKLVVVGDDNVNSGDIRVAQFDSSGSLDWSFNFDVGTTLGGPATTDTASAVAIRGGGTVVVSGTGGDHMFVAEASGGALVPGFGTAGVAQVTFLDPSLNPYVSQNKGMTLDANGMAVLVGNITNTSSATQDFAAARVTTSGTLDGSFNESAPFANDGGTLIVDDPTNFETFNAVVTSGADIFAVGNKGAMGVLAHITAEGTYDTGFGGDGLVEVAGMGGGALNMALDGAGKLLIVGAPGNGQFSLSRYTTAGAADASFDESVPGANDGDGNVQTPVGGFAVSNGVAVQDDGRIVLAGTSFDAFPAFTTADLALARYGQVGGGGNQVTALYANGTLTITGTTDADDVRVVQTGSQLDVRVTVNNVETSAGTAPVEENDELTLIDFNGDDGDDVFRIADNVSNPSELVGGGGNDVLVGGAGADSIAGGDGRDVVIGGSGADMLVGEAESDVLVAGYTIYDNNVTALRAIRDEWSAPNLSFFARVNSLQTGTYSLIAEESVLDDEVRDTLTGGAASDWFLIHLNGPTTDLIMDLNSLELLGALDFLLTP
jgi:uncharacterized delta-60 repeat protein